MGQQQQGKPPVPASATGGSVPGTVSGLLTLADGGRWTAGGVQVGTVSIGGNGFGGTASPGTIDVAAGPGGAPTTLDAAAIALGSDGDNPDAATPSVSGTLDVTGGSAVATSSLSLVDGSQVSIDVQSSVVLGAASSVAGALVVAPGALLGAITGVIAGNVVLDGTLAEGPLHFPLLQDNGTGLSIFGALTGSGTLMAGATAGQGGQLDFPGAPLLIADASEFAGAVSLVDGQTLELGPSGMPHALLLMNFATIDILDAAFTGGQPSYDPATGLLVTDGDVTLDVGTGHSLGDFAASDDGRGGTLIIGHRMPTWQANAAGPGGAWDDASHWSTGNLPLTTDTVAIGPGVSAAASWTVSVSFRTVADLTLGMAAGTLAVTGGFSVSNMLSLESGTLLDAGSGAIGTADFTQSGGALDVAGGTLFTPIASLDGNAAATVQGGGNWTANQLDLAVSGTAAADALDVVGGTLAVQDTLALGTVSFAQSVAATGTVALSDGASVSAAALTLSPGSQVELDATSSLVLGRSSVAAVAGAVVVGAGGSLGVTGLASVTGNLVDLGGRVLLGANSISGGGNAGAVISGSLSGGGRVTIDSDAAFGSAAGFTGTLVIVDSLTLGSGAAPTGLVQFAPGHLGATLDLRGVAWQGAAPSYHAATGQLAIGSTTLDVGAPLPGIVFAAARDTAGGTAVTAAVPCYAAGTRIATADGEVAVEALRPGDRVRSHAGRLAPVVWVGHMRVDLRRHPAPQHAAPVRIMAAAFAPDRPRRDLLVSPDHALLVDGFLVPARLLVNDASICQDVGRGHVTYVHVALDRHDLLLAEGVPAESYLDTGNRGLFAAEAGVRPLFPDFTAGDIAASRRHFAEHGCAPLVLEGPHLVAARKRLLARAASLGHSLTDDPALQVFAGSRPLAAETDGRQWRVALPAGARRARLVSRTWVPYHAHPAQADARRLGVAIARLWLDRRQVSLASPALGAGWHSPEPDWRWTDGDAALDLPDIRELGLAVAMTGRYWRPLPPAAFVMRARR